VTLILWIWVVYNRKRWLFSFLITAFALEIGAVTVLLAVSIPSEVGTMTYAWGFKIFDELILQHSLYFFQEEAFVLRRAPSSPSKSYGRLFLLLTFAYWQCLCIKASELLFRARYDPRLAYTTWYTGILSLIFLRKWHRNSKDLDAKYPYHVFRITASYFVCMVMWVCANVCILRNIFLCLLLIVLFRSRD
jgi:hypothetical protein